MNQIQYTENNQENTELAATAEATGPENLVKIYLFIFIAMFATLVAINVYQHFVPQTPQAAPSQIFKSGVL